MMNSRQRDGRGIISQLNGMTMSRKTAKVNVGNSNEVSAGMLPALPDGVRERAAASAAEAHYPAVRPGPWQDRAVTEHVMAPGGGELVSERAERRVTIRVGHPRLVVSESRYT